MFDKVFFNNQVTIAGRVVGEFDVIGSEPSEQFQ